MKIDTRAAIALGLLLALARPSPSSGDQNSFRISGWVDLSDRVEKLALDETGRSLDDLALFNFAVNSEGGLSERALDELDPYMKKVRAKGGALYLTFVDFTGSAHALLESSSLARTFAKNATRACVDHDLDGIDLDFERLERSQKDAFTRVCRELASELHAKGKRLSVAILARTRDADIPGNAAAQDVAALGAIVDRLELMTYDYAGPWSGADPVGPLDWASRVVDFAESKGVSRSKLFLGIPLYGRSWPGGRNVRADSVRSLAASSGASLRFDETRGESTLHAGGRTIWLTDSRSIDAKVRFARDAGLGGVCLFSVGWACDPELRALEHARRGSIAGALHER